MSDAARPVRYSVAVVVAIVHSIHCERASGQAPGPNPPVKVVVPPPVTPNDVPEPPIFSASGRSGRVPTGAVRIDAANPPANLRNHPVELAAGADGRVGFRLSAPHKLTAELADVMATVANIDYFDCRGNRVIDDHSLDHLAKLPQIDQLDLTGTAVTDAGLAKLSRVAPHLQYLSLEGTAITDAGLTHLAQLQHLRHLIVSRTTVSDAGVAQLAKLKNLQELWLDRTAVTDGVAGSLAKLRLFQLSLRFTRISGRLFSQLGEQPYLGTIWADGTPLSVADLKHFSGLKGLRTLSLMRTGIKEIGDAEAAVLPDLQFCHLGDGTDVAKHIARISLVEDFGLPAFRAPNGLRTFDE
jgi:hypothetical protein